MRLVLSFSMKDKSSATDFVRHVVPSPANGLRWGFMGVFAFSFTVIFTRVAVGGLSPLFVGSARAVVAAVLAAVALWFMRQHLPRGRQWVRLLVVAGGVVVGFPLLTSFALQAVPASHGAVLIALLPAATAVMVVIRTGERPPRAFWVMAVIGAIAAIFFALIQGGGLGNLHPSDLLLFGAVIAAAVGYAEGGLLSRELGSWQTVSWALVLVSPVMIVLTLIAAITDPPHGSATEWAAFGYLAVVSMFLGFFAWYRGLAIGPMASVSQVQLVQPVMSILWAAVILREQITFATVIGGLVVVLCAGLAVRTRLGRSVGPLAAMNTKEAS